MFARPKEPTNRLENTSQGGQTKLPPEAWIVDELKQFGVIQTGRKWNLNLKGKVHTIFDQKRWNMKQARYDALEQSFLLATRLLEVGGPYLCNFLPDQIFNFEEQHDATVRRLVVNDNRTKAEIDAANAAFVGMADSLQWEENRKMLTNTGRWGLNHASYEGDSKAIVPEEDTNEDPLYEWEEAGEQAEEAGQQHRQITITIASEYVDAILASKPDSDHRLGVVFLAAVNMVHELGHTIYYHDLRSDGGGFWVGDDINAETGHSFIAWLFDGWLPEPIDLGNKKDHLAMKNGLHWLKWYRRPVVKPRATYRYSIPLAHIQRLFDQSEWSKFDTSKDSLRIRHELLRPKTPFRNGEHARTARMLGQFAWTMGYQGYQDRTEDDDDEDAAYFARISGSNSSKLAIDEDWTDEVVKTEEPAEVRTVAKGIETIVISSSSSSEGAIKKTRPPKRARSEEVLETSSSEGGKAKKSRRPKRARREVEEQETEEYQRRKRARREGVDPARPQGGLFGGFRGGGYGEESGRSARPTPRTTGTRPTGEPPGLGGKSRGAAQPVPQGGPKPVPRGGAKPVPRGGAKPVPRGSAKPAATSTGGPARGTRSRSKSGERQQGSGRGKGGK